MVVVTGTPGKEALMGSWCWNGRTDWTGLLTVFIDWYSAKRRRDMEAGINEQSCVLNQASTGLASLCATAAARMEIDVCGSLQTTKETSG